jgi:2-keto-4-pentenoate hydratase/2-oxohepta-3-ene-1,7-dioic acid hydratase in catechol pathway
MRLYVFDDFRLGASVSDGFLADVTSVVSSEVAPEHRMTALIAGWDPRAVERAVSAGPRVALDEVVLRAPQPWPGTLIAAPVNYRRHQQEMGGAEGVYAGATIATIETYAGFVKASGSVVGPDGPNELPLPGRRVDHEAELGVVIGAGGRNIPRVEALDHVFGSVPLRDITLRGEEDRSYRKSFDTFTPMGPAIVTADEVGDPGALDIALTVAGQPRQQANTRDLIYDVPRLIELYSGAITLRPGDVIATGTPEGVGPIEDGDEVVLTIERVGRLRMAVAAKQTADV